MKFLKVVALCMALTACSASYSGNQIKSATSTHLYEIQGQGHPTIIMQSGLADTMEKWGVVVNKLQTLSSVLIYNRAGFKGSRSNNNLRNAESINSELNEVIEALELTAPFILIGHSLGGAYMENFAKRYPQLVAGIVLIDPYTTRFPEACKQAGGEFCDAPFEVPIWAKIFLDDAAVGEIKSWPETNKQVNSLSFHDSIPLVLITRNNGSLSKDLSEVMEKVYESMLGMSQNAKRMHCDSCGHYIHLENPDLIVEAVQWLLIQREEKLN